MQGLPLQALQQRARVLGVSVQTMADMAQMDANLVRTPSVQPAMHPTGLLVGVQAQGRGASRLARLASQIHHRHAQAVLG
ncbi:MAG: hypothetical protein RLZZ395_2483, partial [Pseudomonadota bacterium]